MAGYDDTREKILKTLLQRPNGTQIQPDNHQDFALSLLEYIRDVELISTSTLVGIAYENTIPVQPNKSNVSYIAGVAQQRTSTFSNFRDRNGQPIKVSTGEMEAKLVILYWNKQFWTKQEISANIISESEKAYFYYAFTIRRTYDSKSAMEADVDAPLGNNGKSIKRGEVVSIHNESDSSEDAVYSYEIDNDGNPYWKLQCRLDKLDSRTLDGGRADTVYGGALNIDCGTAN